MLKLKNVMSANAISSLAFGGLFSLQPGLVATFLGGASPAPKLYIFILGILLIVNGLHLFWASMIFLPNKYLILYFSAGDYIWVIATLGLMVSGVWITTTSGVLVGSAVAVVVGIFGTLQLTSRKAMEHSIDKI